MENQSQKQAKLTKNIDTKRSTNISALQEHSLTEFKRFTTTYVFIYRNHF